MSEIEELYASIKGHMAAELEFEKEIKKLRAELEQAQAKIRFLIKRDKESDKHLHASFESKINELETELATAKEIIDGNAKDAILKSLHFEDGVVEFYLQHPMFSLFIDAVAHAFVGAGAVNYLETRVFSDKLGFITITVQKESGKTPHQMIEELKTELAALREDNEKMKDALKELEDWAIAYPIKIFPEPDLKKAHELLKAGGMTLDSISASSMRHVVTRMIDIIHNALPPAPEVEK